MTTEEIKSLIRRSIEIGRRSMVNDLWELEALSQGNGWDEEYMEPLFEVDPVLVEHTYAHINLNK